MDAKELRQKSVIELKTLAQELKVKLRDLRFNATLKQNAKISDLRNSRKDLARVHMILAETLQK